MTQAVCFKCGEIKFGAFVACEHCAATPVTDDDLVLSLALTDHYFAIDVLRQMGKSIKDGQPLRLDEVTRQNLLATLAQTRKTPVRRFLRGTLPKENKSKWWPF